MKSPDFDADQWEFLATLEAFGAPVCLKVVESINVILPSRLLDLLRKCNKAKLLYETAPDTFTIAPDLPDDVRRKVRRINTKKKINSLVSRLKELGLWDELALVPRINLLNRSGRDKEACAAEIDRAKDAIDKGNHYLAYEFLDLSIKKLVPLLGDQETDKNFIWACRTISDLCVLLGKFLPSLPQLLGRGIAASDRLGDRRSKAILMLYSGFYLFLFDRTSEATAFLKEGEALVKELGDADIIEHASCLTGFYHMIHGKNKEAVEHYEKALFTQGTHAASYLLPIYLPFTAAFSGQYDRAIGCLDYYWRMAKQLNRESMACHFRAILGTLLLVINKGEEAFSHLRYAYEAANEIGNEFALWSATLGLAMYHFRRDEFAEAVKLQNNTLSKMEALGITVQTMEPWHLEMLYELQRRGYNPIEGFKFNRLAEKMLNEPNIHLKGVVLRLKALETTARGGLKSQAQKYLSESEAYLKMAPDPVQLAKTQVEMARLKIEEGDQNAARLLAIEARKGLSGHWEEDFPDVLRSLVEESDPDVEMNKSPDTFIMDFQETIGSFPQVLELDIALGTLLSTMNRLLGAERGVIFWSDKKKKINLEARIVRNIDVTEINSESFEPSMSLIRKCFRENRPLMIKQRHGQDKPMTRLPVSLLSLPIEIDSRFRAVVYHDNSYIDDCFSFLSEKTLIQICTHVSQHLKRIIEISQLIEQTKRVVIRESIQSGSAVSSELQAFSPVMRDIVDKADRVARADGSVLIQGATGTGKELLARRIHQMSSRSEYRIVTIDPTTIPENLMESELFGYEKGAFTGADHQKTGRVELAHRGTLFIDEIGEMPKSIQVKLLRILQEKTFVRVGGTKTLYSDFRLIVATNRDLAQEVRKGQFREDLYYRLNTIPITLPPLKDRPEDVLGLARHFLSIYAKKYQKPVLKFSPEDEQHLTGYHWPGNVRELENIIERAVILSDSDQFRLLISDILKPSSTSNSSEFIKLDELNRRHIQLALQKAGGKIGGPGGAAELLGINMHTLRSRMKKLALFNARK